MPSPSPLINTETNSPTILDDAVPAASSAEHTPTSSPVFKARGLNLLHSVRSRSPVEEGSESLRDSWWGRPDRETGRPWHNPPKRQNTIPPDHEIAYERTKYAVARAVDKAVDNVLDGGKEALVLAIDSLHLVPVAGLDIAGKVLLNIWIGVQSVETNRLSCLRLTERCANIYYSVRQEVEIAGPAIAEALYEPVEKLTDSFRGIERFIHKQVSRPFFKRYLKRDEDARKIIACDASLTDSVSLFSVAIQVRMLKGIQELGHHKLIEQYQTPLPIPSHPSSSPDIRHIPQGANNEIVAAIATIRAVQAARDSALDVDDLYNAMRTVLRSGDDMAMLEMLQVDRSEIQEAIKTLQRALEDPRLAPKGTRGYMQQAGADHHAISAQALEDAQAEMVTPAVAAAPAALTTQPPPTWSSTYTSTQPSSPTPGTETAIATTRDPDQDVAFHREFLEGGLEALRRLSGVEGGDESLPPWTITKWEVDRERRIGIGFFSDVYKGTWRGRTVAIKVLVQNTPRGLFRREVSIWASIKHPYVLELLGASSATGDRPWFFVSPYLKNGNLPTFLKGGKVADKTRGRKASPGPLQMMQEITIGMAYLHRKGVLHGDLKANNILIDDEYHCVISDFGQSELRSEVYRLSQKPKPPRGGLRWQAPELISGESNLTPEADVYAFGIVCVEILTNGEVPWPNLEDEVVRTLVLQYNKRPRIPFRPETSLALVSIIETCWGTSPFSRSTFDKVASDLGHLVGGLRGRKISSNSPRPRLEQLIKEAEENRIKSPDMRPLDLPDEDVGQDAGAYVNVEKPSLPQAMLPLQRVVTPSVDVKSTSSTRNNSMQSREFSSTTTTTTTLDSAPDYEAWGGYESPVPQEPEVAARRDERRYRLLLQHNFHPTLNLPLWQPSPVRIGAVGYHSKPRGEFITLFNALKPALAADQRVQHNMPSIHGYGAVHEVSRVDRKNFAQIGLEYIHGLLDFTKGSTGAFSKAVKKRYTYPLRAGHKHAYLCTENTTYRYMVDIDAAKTWFKANISQILSFYGKEHRLHREDVFLVIGTLEAREYGLFVSHEHPDGQVHFNVYADRREGQDWGSFSTDKDLSPSALAGPEYGGDAAPLSSMHASKISTVKSWSDTDVDVVLLAKLRFKPDEADPTRL